MGGQGTTQSKANRGANYEKWANYDLPEWTQHTKKEIRVWSTTRMEQMKVHILVHNIHTVSHKTVWKPLGYRCYSSDT